MGIMGFILARNERYFDAWHMRVKNIC